MDNLINTMKEKYPGKKLTFVLDNLASNFEYVMTPDLGNGNDNLRLALSVRF